MDVSVPCSASITACWGSPQLGERDELAVDFDQHHAVGEPVNVVPERRGSRGGLLTVVKVTSGPKVVPAVLLATSRTW